LRRAQNEFRLRIKKIRSDNGMEFRTLKLKDFLRKRASSMSSLLPTHLNKLVLWRERIELLWILSHPALRNKARCISYMRQEDNIYNNRVYRDKCHKTSENLLHSGRLITK
jgi:hypothetical protein